MKVLLVILILILHSFQALAQEKEKPTIDLQHFIERLFPLQEEEVDYEAIYELLLELYQSPLDLNRATAAAGSVNIWWAGTSGVRIKSCASAFIRFP